MSHGNRASDITAIAGDGRMNGDVFLTYDIKGIQTQLFLIPRLRYVIGASAMIDEIDRQIVPDLAARSGCERIFAGAGHGLICCPTHRVPVMRAGLIREITVERGFDLRLGEHTRATEAIRGATELYAFCPEDMRGEPCPVSGRFPVSDRKEHPVVRKRIRASVRNTAGQRDQVFAGEVLASLATTEDVPARVTRLAQDGRLRFMRNVSPEPGDPAQLQAEAIEGQRSLGNRNRWAVVCADGNSIGKLYERAEETLGRSEQDLLKWLREMSACLDRCTRAAFAFALGSCIDRYLNTDPEPDSGTSLLTIPFRPVLLGGDDVVFLCHPSYALDMVVSMAQRFEELTAACAEALWCGRPHLTMSAGIVFSSVSLPLHASLGYADDLLRGAKRLGRAREEGAGPPACVDWEHLTSSVIDDPARQRARDQMFIDGDTGHRIELTRKPYLLHEFSGSAAALATALGLPPEGELTDVLHGIADRYPRTVWARVEQALRRSKWDRVANIAALGKAYPELASYLWEVDGWGVGWTLSGTGSGGTRVQSTDLLDILSLLEEQHRLTMETAHGC